MLKKQLLCIFIFLAVALTGCAKRGTITGGLKDTIAPVLKTSSPVNYSTDFKGNTFKLTFDEYIKLKNANKQLIISPPMEKAPEVTPTSASRYITVKIKDTLQPNTTYSFNFGESIQDNNESIPFRQFKYVFSTGSYIDSLTLSGTIKDAYSKKIDNFVSVMLYDVNDTTFSDSIIYKSRPRYITNTLDSSTTYKLENLKAGKYLLVALKDANSNYKFDPKTEKIGFHQQYVTVPNDTLYEIELFKEVAAFKAFKPVQASGNRLTMGYEGDTKNAAAQLKKNNENLDILISKFPKKDSLQIWYKPIKVEEKKTDSLQFRFSKDKFDQQFSVKIKNQKKDTLSFKSNYDSSLPLREKFGMTASVPLVKFDNSKITVTNKDSASVAFKTHYDEMTQFFTIDFPKEPLEKYKVTLMPEAVTDYMGNANDTLKYALSTSNTSDFGNLRLKLENVKQYPIIVELTDNKGDVVVSVYEESKSEIAFDLIPPMLYTVRVIYDANKNKEWDSGSFLEKRQTEEVIYFPKEIDVRANWDVEQAFNLKP